MIVGGTSADRRRTADAHEHVHNFRPATRIHLDPASLYWLRVGPGLLSIAGPRLVRIDDLEAAFPDDEGSPVRAILADPVYLLQRLVDTLDSSDRVVMTADARVLGARAPEALDERGPWRFVRVLEAASSSGTGTPRQDPPGPLDTRLAAPGSRQASELITQASICRRLSDRQGARAALDQALALEPDWEAVHFEDGKFWLGEDDLERARAAFERATALMPTFAAAFSNLGATLGELDQPAAARAAFEQAVRHDPRHVSAWNNLGVVNRELGHFDESARALGRAIELAPGFVFAHYNLGHTRLLAGDAVGAVAAYEQGQRLDPDRNRRQACRLAVARFATGDVAGAERDLWRAADAAAGSEREDLLLEAYEAAHALATTRPDLTPHRAFLDRIARALTL
jgi:tetratricopeptide (TPR) repeat protein